MPTLRFPHKRLTSTRHHLRLNRTHAYAQGLEGWWLPQPVHFTGYGQWYDEVTNDPAILNGFSVSNPFSGWGTSSRAGSYGEIRRSGVNDYMAIRNIFGTRLKGTSATIMCWIYIRSLSAASAVFDTNTAVGNRQLIFVLSTTTTGHMGACGDGGGAVTFSEAWTVGEWQHLTMVIRDSGIVAYRNGLAVGTNAGNTVGTGFTSQESGTPIEWRIGVNPSTGFGAFEGAHDDIRAYSREIDAAEVLAIYRNSLTGCPGLLERPRSVWRGSPGVGTTTAELSPALFQWQTQATRPNYGLKPTPSLLTWLTPPPSITGPIPGARILFGQPRRIYALRQRYAPRIAIDPSHPLNRGLLAWYLPSSSQMQGSVLVDLVSNELAELRSMSANALTSGPQPPSRPGSYGEIRLDGSDDQIIIPNLLGQTLQGFNATLSLWFYADTLGGYRALLDTNTASNARELAFYIESATLVWRATFGATGANVTLDIEIETGQWHHLVLTWRSTGTRAYLDGHLASSQTIAFVGGFSQAPLHIGGNPSGSGSAFRGRVDDIRFWNREMDSQEVLDLYEQCLTGSLPMLYNPRGLWVAGGAGHYSINVQPGRLQWRAGAGINASKEPNLPVFTPMRFLRTPRTRYLPTTAVNRSESLTAGLVAWFSVHPWMFTGSVFYDLLEGKNGALLGMATHNGVQGWAPTAAPGGRGSLGFAPDTNTVVVASDETISNLSQFTLTAWIHPRSFGAFGRAHIFDKIGLAGLAGWRLAITNIEGQVRTLELDIAGATMMTAFAPMACIEVNTWQHLIVVWTGSYLRSNLAFYVNGQQLLAQSSVGNDGTAPIVDDLDIPLHIGNRDNRDRAFDGYLDDLKIYNRALSPPEAIALYQESLTGHPRLLQLPRRLLTTSRLPAHATGARTIVAQPARFVWVAQFLPTEGFRRIQPARGVWRASTPTLVRGYTVSAAYIQWSASSTLPRISVIARPAQVQWYAQTLPQTRIVSMEPSRLAWQRSLVEASQYFDPPGRPVTRVPMVLRHLRKPKGRAEIDFAHPLARDLEAFWLFNEGDGNCIYDLSGNQHHILVGLAGAGSRPVHARWAAGRFGGAGLECLPTGVTGLAGDPPNIVPRMLWHVPPGAAFGTRQLCATFSFWLIRHEDSFSRSMLLASDFPGATLNGISLRDSGTGYVPTYQAIGGPGQLLFVGNRILAFGEAYHIALVIDMALAETVRIFINGKLDAVRDVGAANGEFFRYQYAFHDPFGGNFSGIMDQMAVWNVPLSDDAIQYLYVHPLALLKKRMVLIAHQQTVFTIPAATIQWQVQAPVRVPFVLPGPAQLVWRGQRLIVQGQVLPAVMQWQANAVSIPLNVEVRPAYHVWRAHRVSGPLGVVTRECPPEYEVALHKPFVHGDWLVRAPAMGLALSLDFQLGTDFEHRLLDISDIEVSVPPGGGIASVANVTISVLETGEGQSITELWQTAAATGSVEVTIDFLIAGGEDVFRVFTGRIDNITVRDHVAQMLLVDDSIRRNLVLPRELVSDVVYVNAEQGSLTKPIPLVYGRGSKIGAAPMLFVDVTTNIYLVAAHAMTLGGKLAVYDQPTSTYLLLDSVLFIPNNATATITLGTISTDRLQFTNTVGSVAFPTGVVDGMSIIVTKIGTDGSYLIPEWSAISANGTGFVGIHFSAPGYPQTTTVLLTIANHRRSPGTAPTVTGTFFLRTISAQDGTHARILFTTETFNHTTSAHTNEYVISNLRIGINERLGMVIKAENTGGLGSAGATYEVGEVSITPLLAFSANTSASPTAVGLPINTQELRFNRQRGVLSLYVASAVTNAGQAIDGNSLTTAVVRTTGIDSNLDGIGELIFTASVTSAQRANNTVLIDLINHRRGAQSDPTVTGTFSIQTYNRDTGVLLRDNLLQTQAFRHVTNPQKTSFVATALNVGETTQLAVRLVARNEGGSGTTSNFYEVGEIEMETFYQPRGDSADIYLYGEGYSGRTDPDGSVTAYIDLGAGTLLDSPEMVIASMYILELGMEIDEAAFAVAYTFFRDNDLTFDGGIGAGWARSQLSARELLDDLARQCTSILFPSFGGNWGIRPYRTDTGTHDSFDVSNILTVEGSESQRPEDRLSTFQMSLGNFQNVYNDFEVRYRWNSGAGKYDGLLKVSGETSNLPSSMSNKTALEALCAESFARYGDIEPMIFEAYWIADDMTAQYLLTHLVNYFALQRIGIQFETTLQALCLQVGDFITVTYPGIPDADNGGRYEVHTIRYMPLKGRIQISCSKVATLPAI